MTNRNAILWLKAITYIGIYGGLLMPLMFVPVVIFPFVFSKLIFFQILIGLTFPAYLTLAWLEPSYRPRWSILYLAILGYFVALGLSVAFSVDPLRSWWGNQERMNGLFTVLHFLAWLTMASSLLTTWEQWRRLLKYQIALSVFMACVALLQKPFPNLLRFPAGDRVGGLLDNPIYMGAYQIFNLAFIGLVWLKGSSRSVKIWLACAAVLDIAAFLATQSRGALVGLGVGVVTFAVAYSLMTPNRKTKKIVLGVTAALFVVYGLAFAFRGTEFIKKTPLARLTSFSSTRPRLIAWDIAWKGFLERPITGWGYDTFHILFNKKYNPESLHFGYYETWFDRSHNTIMDVLSMTGILGLAMFAAIFISLYWSVIRAYRKGWSDIATTSILIALPAAYFVQNLFVFDHPAAFSMSYLLYAFVIVATSSHFSDLHVREAAQTSQSSRALPWIGCLVLYILAASIIWRWSWLPAQASVLSIKSNNANGAGQYEQAHQLATQAFAIPTPYLDEQTFLQSRNFIGLAASGKLTQYPFWKDWHDLILRMSRKHIEEHPQNTHPRFIFARFTEAMASFIPEDADITDEQYRKAIELSPKRQQLYYSYARFLVTRQRLDEAQSYMKQVLAFDEEVGESHWLLGLHLMFDRGQLKEGAEEMARSQKVTAPYSLQDAREALALAMAYDVLGDAAAMHDLLERLSVLPQSDVNTYLQIARLMEKNNLIQERNAILNALARIDKELARQLQPLATGSATSIDAAIKQTQASAPSAPTAQPTITPVPIENNAEQRGPRR